MEIHTTCMGGMGEFCNAVDKKNQSKGFKRKLEKKKTTTTLFALNGWKVG